MSQTEKSATEATANQVGTIGKLLLDSDESLQNKQRERSSASKKSVSVLARRP